MNISVRNLSFGYAGKPLFDRLSFDVEDDGRPLVILWPSGCGKTTLLKLIGGLLKPQEGEICFGGEAGAVAKVDGAPRTAFMFQEGRLLPWLTVLENISLPLEKEFGREEAGKRGRYFLSLVSLEEKEKESPMELSGGQAQRVSMARAFAWPAPALFMDEPFQSLDIPLRINLMDLTLSLLSKEKRLLIIVTHDPREAVYMGGRIIILGKPGEGIVYDRKIDLGTGERTYGSAGELELELELLKNLSHNGTKH
jgi:NitT/TauT family transport system ATP-binding protein